jgi:hypothetical protein
MKHLQMRDTLRPDWPRLVYFIVIGILTEQLSNRSGIDVLLEQEQLIQRGTKNELRIITFIGGSTEVAGNKRR